MEKAEKHTGSSESLTDLSSVSSEEEASVPSHRRFSSTSLIKSGAVSTANSKQRPSGTTQNIDEEKTDADDDASSQNEDTFSSLDFRQRPVIPTIEVSEEESTDPHAVDQTQMSQPNRSSKSNKLNGSMATSIAAEEEVRRLHGQVADMQDDIGQLLQYTQLLNEENVALKKLLKDAVIVSDDGNNMSQLTDTLLASTHEQPALRSVAPPQPRGIRSEPLKRKNQIDQMGLPKVPSASDIIAIPTNLSAFRVYSEEMTPSSYSHHALKVESFDSRHTVIPLKTDTLRPQTNTLTASRRMDNSVSPSVFAAESIKKLHNLTFENGKKAGGEREEDHEREEQSERRRKEPSAGKSGNVRKWSARGSKRRELRQRNAKSEVSPDIPHGNQPERRTTVSGNKVEKPNFYLRDILPILQERNKLKERVHLLECEIESLKRILDPPLLSRRGWEGMLVEVPEEVQTLSESPAGEIQAKATTMRLLPSVCDKEPYFTDAVATKYVPCGLHKVYSLEVTRSDGQRFEIYRRYGEFFTFHHTLVQLFPEEAGTYNSKQRVLPTLPSIEDVLISSHLKSINIYCQILLTKLNRSIARSVFVTNFFNPSPKDKELPRLQRPFARSEFDVSDVFQMSLSARGQSEEEYILLADYVTDAVGELSLTAGDVVQLINRETTGWWLVSTRVTEEGESEKVGRVPGDFLKRYDATDDHHNQSYTNGESSSTRVSPEEILVGVTDPSMLYVAVEDYQAKDPGQISFAEGAQLIVLELCEDGWWLAWCEGKEGWVPASFLSPGTKIDDSTSALKWTDTPTSRTTGLQYITMAAYGTQEEVDVTFPDCAIVDVFNRSLTGWWKVSGYEGSTGLAPATLLALTDSDFNFADGEAAKEERVACSSGIGHSISGYIDPPPRSQKYLRLLRRSGSQS